MIKHASVNMPKSSPHSMYLWLCLQTAVASLVGMTACDREFRRQSHLIDDYALVLLEHFYFLLCDVSGIAKAA
jgi:hypothetical protein